MRCPNCQTPIGDEYFCPTCGRHTGRSGMIPVTEREKRTALDLQFFRESRAAKAVPDEPEWFSTPPDNVTGEFTIRYGPAEPLESGVRGSDPPVETITLVGRKVWGAGREERPEAVSAEADNEGAQALSEPEPDGARDQSPVLPLPGVRRSGDASQTGPDGAVAREIMDNSNQNQNRDGNLEAEQLLRGNSRREELYRQAEAYQKSLVEKSGGGDDDITGFTFPGGIFGTTDLSGIAGQGRKPSPLRAAGREEKEEREEKPFPELPAPEVCLSESDDVPDMEIPDDPAPGFFTPDPRPTRGLGELAARKPGTGVNPTLGRRTQERLEIGSGSDDDAANPYRFQPRRPQRREPGLFGLRDIQRKTAEMPPASLAPVSGEQESSAFPAAAQTESPAQTLAVAALRESVDSFPADGCDPRPTSGMGADAFYYSDIPEGHEGQVECLSSLLGISELLLNELAGMTDRVEEQEIEEARRLAEASGGWILDTLLEGEESPLGAPVAQSGGDELFFRGTSAVSPDYAPCPEDISELDPGAPQWFAPKDFEEFASEYPQDYMPGTTGDDLKTGFEDYPEGFEEQTGWFEPNAAGYEEFVSVFGSQDLDSEDDGSVPEDFAPQLPLGFGDYSSVFSNPTGRELPDAGFETRAEPARESVPSTKSLPELRSILMEASSSDTPVGAVFESGNLDFRKRIPRRFAFSDPVGIYEQTQPPQTREREAYVPVPAPEPVQEPAQTKAPSRKQRRPKRQKKAMRAKPARRTARPSRKRSRTVRKTVVVQVLFMLVALIASAAVLMAAWQAREDRYESALALFKEGRYQEASMSFTQLIRDYPNTYPDAPDYVSYSTGMILFELGDYAQAEGIFRELGPFLDSQAKTLYCFEINTYAAAGARFAEGRYFDAWSAYESLGDYRDAAQRKLECIRPVPASGVLYRDPQATREATLNLRLSSESETHMLVCLYLLKDGKEAIAARVYLAGGSSASVQLPAGEYVFKTASGPPERWFGEKDMFGDEPAVYSLRENGESDSFPVKSGANAFEFDTSREGRLPEGYRIIAKKDIH